MLNISISGGGLDDLDNAFKATTTYQPSVPLSDEEIEVPIQLKNCF